MRLFQVPACNRSLIQRSVRVVSLTLPDNTTVTNQYWLTGQLKQTAGSRTYPVEYGYDAQGRMKAMTNWTGFAAGAGARVTTWNWNAYRGWLDSKQYADGQGPSYGYSAAGRLLTNTWARVVPGTQNLLQRVTAYNTAGDPQTVSYNDSATPNLTYSYDRRGRQTSVTRTLGGTNLSAVSLSYNDANQLTGEVCTNGAFAGLGVTNVYDAQLRRGTNGHTLNGSYVVWSTLTYDAASRLQTVSDGTESATYSYLANSPLVSQIVFKQSGATRVATTKQYDKLNRLLSISSATNSAPAPVNAYTYPYNDANQRLGLTLADGSHWAYQYDALGQVISGKWYWSDGTPVAGQQFGYGFDDIGNRSSTLAGGDQNGANLRSASYTANSLNQYTQRTNAPYVDVLAQLRLRKTALYGFP